MALIKCPECGKEVSSAATNCPNCGHPISQGKQIVKETVVKEKKKRGCLSTILLFVIVVAVIGAFASGGDDKKVKDATKNTSSSSTPSDSNSETENTEKTEFSIGETAEQKNVQVTLLSVTESNGSEYVKPDDGNVFLLCEFEIANNSDKDIAISSIASFEAYCDDYSLNQDLLGLQAPEAQGKSQLDGSVAAGKKMKGVIAYQVSSGYKNFEISISPDFWSGKDIKFVVTK